MSFVSIEFALAALVFFPLYWGLRAHRNVQVIFLAASGYLLYATWSVDAVIMLFGFSLYIWLAGLWIGAAAGDRTPRLRMAIGLLVTVMVLLFYKYYEFIRQFASEALQDTGLQALMPVVDIVAPVGISFFTFQAISYLVWQGQSRVPVGAQTGTDAQGRRTSFHTSFIEVLLYLGFWPTHFAGPIFRAEEFFRQLAGSAFGAPIQVSRAAYLILLGLAQKMVFANWLDSTFVAEAFKYPETQGAISTLAAVLGYSLQIFLDFSGYSLIVTGLALLLGFDLPLNFRQPYLASSLRDFWRGWHISLSSFIRDYVYIPLGGSRKGFLVAQVNTLAAMLISGLWHGANYNFLFWGLLHGAGAVAQNVWEKLVGRDRLPGVATHLLTLAYVGFAWVFFRAESSEAAWSLVGGLGRGLGEFTLQHLYLALFTLVFFMCSRHAAGIEQGMVSLIGRYRGWRLASAATAVVFLIILFGPSGVPGFIYYRF